MTRNLMKGGRTEFISSVFPEPTGYKEALLRLKEGFRMLRMTLTYVRTILCEFWRSER
jgi:hypothetical protein